MLEIIRLRLKFRSARQTLEERVGIRFSEIPSHAALFQKFRRNNGASFSQDAGNALLFRLTAVQMLEMFKEITDAGGMVAADALVAAVRIHDASYDWSEKAPDRIVFEKIRGQWLAMDFFNKAKNLGLNLSPPQFANR